MIGRNLVALPERQHDSSPYIARFVPALNLATLEARPREDKQLLLWYCLGSIDVTGRGVLDQKQAINILKASFGYQRQTAYKHLQAGDGIYWRRHTIRKSRAIIVLYSLIRVAQHLEADIRGTSTRSSSKKSAGPVIRGKASKDRWLRNMSLVLLEIAERLEAGIPKQNHGITPMLIQLKPARRNNPKGTNLEKTETFHAQPAQSVPQNDQQGEREERNV
jgi:hypothetical protein